MNRRILILTPQLPYPPHQGASLRNYHIIQGLARHSAIGLLSFVESQQSTKPADIGPLLDLCHTLKTVPIPERSANLRLRQLVTTNEPDMKHRLTSTEFDRQLEQILVDWQPTIVQIEGIELARVIPTIRRILPSVRIVFDNHNAETELQRRTMLTDLRQPRRWIAAAYSAIQVQRLRRFERWACSSADAVTTVSQTDAEIISRLLLPNLQQIKAIPNCIDVSTYDFPHTQPLDSVDSWDLVFIGKMDYRPNVDAMIWFMESIWPRIKGVRPQTTLAIVGQKPTKKIASYDRLKGVNVTGFVPEVRSYISRAQIVIMPLRMGSGTRLKLLEALAAGKAVISTSIGAEGYPVKDGHHLLLADNPETITNKIITLLNDPYQRQTLGQQAKTFAQMYDWRVVINQFSELHNQLVSTESITNTPPSSHPSSHL